MESPTARDATFDANVAPHRRELHVHCYRMLGSFDEAEDAVQETLLKAWRGRDTYNGPSYRAWLYRIATNVCLDAHRRSKRRPLPNATATLGDVPWLQPYPDRLLDEIAPRGAEPEEIAVARESIELAFLAAIQLLPPRQRAVLILRDVLAWSAAETASFLDASVPAINSALQRARATLQEHRPHSRIAGPRPAEPTADEREILDRFIDAHQRADATATAELLRDDVRIHMPPQTRFDDAASYLAVLEEALTSRGTWRLVPIGANRQPAAATYLRRHGQTEFRAFKIDVLRIEGGLIAEIMAFDESLFPAFGLPPTL
jgi:RNA polymerase sigma-70 factor (ECF subfamily)